MMLKLWPVYQGVWGNFPSTPDVFEAVWRWENSVRRFPDHPSQHVIIPDNVAQCIASWWHSPGSPYSTVLSTRGIVDRYMSLSDFGDPDDAETEDDRAALRALGAYIAAKQAGAQSSSRPCACRDCRELTTGIPGELCWACDLAGCDATDETAGCDVPGAYGDE